MLFRGLLLLVLALVIARAVWRLMAGIAQGVSGSAPGASPGRRREPSPTRMVQDPVCGVYVVPGKALELARGSQTVYFCSDACRTRFKGKAHAPAS